MRDIVMVVSNHNDEADPLMAIDAIKKAGFKSVFIQWYHRNWIITKEEQLEYIKKQGLRIAFAHLCFDQINHIWEEGIEGDRIIDVYKEDIKTCSDNSIPLVIMHLTSGFEPPARNELGLERLRNLCDYAKSLNIKIAFENTKIKGYLEYVLDNIKNDNVGVCFDSGHYHAHFKDDFDFDRFKDRYLAIHLHDNDQSDDQHLIPFDGTLDWNYVIKKLKDCNYEGDVTIESHYRNKYYNIGIEAFCKRCYEAGQKIQEMFEL